MNEDTSKEMKIPENEDTGKNWETNEENINLEELENES